MPVVETLSIQIEIIFKCISKEYGHIYRIKLNIREIYIFIYQVLITQYNLII